MLLRGNIPLDPLFNEEEFFKIPVITITHVTKLNFPIPENVDSLEDFLTRDGEAFRVGVINLVNELKTLAREQNILDEVASDALEEFIQVFNFHKNTEGYNKIAFPLFTQGITQLAEIIDLVKPDQNWSDAKKEIIQHLLYGMDECPPGTLTNIAKAKMALAAECREQLMHYRYTLADQVISLILIKHDKKNGGDLEIPDGTAMHHINAMLNLYHEALGFHATDDEYASRIKHSDALQEEFANSITNNLSVDYILQSILDNDMSRPTLSSTDPLLVEKYIDNYSEWLIKFGADKKSLSYQLAYLDSANKRHLKEHVEYYLIHNIFERLANNKLLDKSKMKQSVLPTHSDVTFFMPPFRNIKLAYVVPNDQGEVDEPFVLYYYQQLLEEAKDGLDRTNNLLQLCQEDQRQELHEEIVKLIAKDWPDYVSNNTETNVETFIVYFSNKFPKNCLSLIEMIRTSRLDAEHLQQFISRLGLSQRVSEANNVEILLSYLELFPKENWGTIVLTELQAMDLLQHNTAIKKTIDVLQKISLDLLTKYNLKRIYDKGCLDFISLLSMINDRYPTLQTADNIQRIISANTSITSLKENLTFITDDYPDFFDDNNLFELYVQSPTQFSHFVNTIHILPKAYPEIINKEQLAKLFIAQNNNDDAAVLSKYFSLLLDNLPNEMFAVFGYAQRAKNMLAALIAAKQHAGRLAKGIYVLYDASAYGTDLFTADTLQLMQSYGANAERIADLLVIFHLGLKTDLNKELITYLNEHKDHVDNFFQLCALDQSLYDWVFFFVENKVINEKSMKRLLENPNQLVDIVDTLEALHHLDPELCEKNANLIIEYANEPDLLNSIITLTKRHKSEENPLIDPENELAEIMKDTTVSHTRTHGIFARSRMPEQTEAATLESNIGLDKS